MLLSVSQMEWFHYENAFRFLRENTPEDTVVVSSWPYSTYLLTQREVLNQYPGRTLEDILSTAPISHPLYVLATWREHPMTGVEFGMQPIKNFSDRHPGCLP